MRSFKMFLEVSLKDMLKAITQHQRMLKVLPILLFLFVALRLYELSTKTSKPLKKYLKGHVFNAYKSEDKKNIVVKNNSLIKDKVLNWSRIYSKKSFTLLPKQYEEIVENPNSSFTCGSKNLLRPWLHLKQAETKDMIFFIKAAPKHSRQREVIRHTWGKIRMLFNKKFATIFVVARTEDDSVQSDLEKENEQYGDMLQCDFVDSYRSLPIKVLSTFRWIIENNINSSYYTMTDDDCVMNLKEIVRFLQSEQPQNYLHCGFKFSINMYPVRGGKWGIDQNMYSNNVYPGFCHGPMYTLQRPIMDDLYTMSKWTKLGDFYLEDVYITGILRYKLGLENNNLGEYRLEDNVILSPMVHADSDSPKVLYTIQRKWTEFNQKLPWDLNSETGEPLITVYEFAKN